MINQIDLTKLFDPNLIFEASPSPVGLYLWTPVIYGLSLILAVALIIILRRNSRSIYKNLWYKFIYLLIFIGLAGPILVFFRWQSIPYLGSRLFILIIWLVAFLWFLEILWYWFRILPAEIKKQKEKERFEKYLPRRQAGLPSRKK